MTPLYIITAAIFLAFIVGFVACVFMYRADPSKYVISEHEEDNYL